MSDASSSLAVQGYAGERLYLLLRAKGQFRAAGELAQTRIAAEGGSPETEKQLHAATLQVHYLTAAKGELAQVGANIHTDDEFARTSWDVRRFLWAPRLGCTHHPSTSAVGSLRATTHPPKPAPVSRAPLRNFTKRFSN